MRLRKAFGVVNYEVWRLRKAFGVVKYEVWRLCRHPGEPKKRKNTRKIKGFGGVQAGKQAARLAGKQAGKS